MKFQCPECEGLGGETEAVLWTGEGPWYECWACKGRGALSLYQRFLWLPWLLHIEFKWPERLWRLYPRYWKAFIQEGWHHEVD